MLPKKICFVDIETTGTSLTSDRIIEIGIVKIENNRLVEKFQTLINPGMSVDPFIEQMTGITKKDLETAPLFFEVKEKVLEMLEDSVFAAHNARFDYGFLRHEFKRNYLSFSSKHFCTVKLSRFLFPRFKRHNLDSLIQRFGLKCKNRHRAFDDAKVLWDFYQILQKQFGEEKLLNAYKAITKQPSLPVGLGKKTVDRLPESPGVYIFYGEKETPLYIGKSINIKDRVYSHFVNDLNASREMKMSQQIKDIKTIKTSGELGALILESRLIKKMQPLYNRQLRYSYKMLVLKKVTTSQGYETVVFDTLENVNLEELDRIMGVCKSKRQAKEFLLKLCKEYSLCQKLLGLEKTKSSCFYYRLGWCKGACINQENVLKYNIRFIQAFSNHKIKPWPFDGPVIIQDYDFFEETKEQFLVDKWCLLGTVKTDSFESYDRVDREYAFDYDLYKILRRYLQNKNNWKSIKQVSIAENYKDLPEAGVSAANAL